MSIVPPALKNRDSSHINYLFPAPRLRSPTKIVRFSGFFAILSSNKAAEGDFAALKAGLRQEIGHGMLCQSKRADLPERTTTPGWNR
jgi:hypothetical protein